MSIPLTFCVLCEPTEVVRAIDICYIVVMCLLIVFVCRFVFGLIHWMERRNTLKVSVLHCNVLHILIDINVY